jgi:hypothetical protein
VTQTPTPAGRPTGAPPARVPGRPRRPAHAERGGAVGDRLYFYQSDFRRSYLLPDTVRSDIASP